MLMLSVISVFLFVAVLIGGTVYLYVNRRTAAQQRLDKLINPVQMEINSSLLHKDTPLQEFFTRFGKWLPTNKKDTHTYSRTLVAAGFRRETVPVFIGVKILLAMVFPALYLVFYALPNGMLLNSMTLLYALALAILGFLLPGMIVQQIVNKRHTEIFHTLPDILDLITVCVEAGISIDAALVKACGNPLFRGNPLTEEFKKVSQETRAGKPRSDAMRDMAERTMVQDVSSFVTMLIQTERFGTSLSKALRIHSDSLRTKRRQIAEEKAAKTAVKLMFPLVIFVFPSLFVVLLGPAVIMLKDFFK